MVTIKKTTRLPGTECDICHKQCREVIIDAPTSYGPWAHMCESCFVLRGREPASKFVLQAEQPKHANKHKAMLEHAHALTDDQIEAMMFDSIVETACPDGCEVEPDGKCCHGYLSPLRILGII